MRPNSLTKALILFITIFAFSSAAHAQFGALLKTLNKAVEQAQTAQKKQRPNDTGDATVQDGLPSSGEQEVFGGNHGASTSGIPYAVYIMTGGTNGYTSIGTIASSEDICSLLSHPIFQQRPEIWEQLGKINGVPNIDPKGLSSKWLVSRIGKIQNLPTDAWRVRDLVILERNLEICLKKKSTENPNLYQILDAYFLPLARQPRREIPCYENPGEYQETMDGTGRIQKVLVPVPGRRKCLDFTYGAWHLNYMNGTLFTILLSMREGHGPLKSLLEVAYRDLIERGYLQPSTQNSTVDISSLASKSPPVSLTEMKDMEKHLGNSSYLLRYAERYFEVTGDAEFDDTGNVYPIVSRGAPFTVMCENFIGARPRAHKGSNDQNLARIGGELSDPILGSADSDVGSVYLYYLKNCRDAKASNKLANDEASEPKLKAAELDRQLIGKKDGFCTRAFCTGTYISASGLERFPQRLNREGFRWR